MSSCEETLELLRDDLFSAEPNSGDEQNLLRIYVTTWLDCEGHPENSFSPDVLRRSTPQELPGLANDIVRSLRYTKPSIEPAIVEELIVAVVLSAENGSTDATQEQVHRGADPVMLYKGQFAHEVEDIRIDGAGMDFVFKRTYKNQVPFDGPLGFNWTHNFHSWLRVANQTIFRSTGQLREEPYTRHPKFGEGGSGEFDYWIPPDGAHGVIFETGDSFVLRMPDGVEHQFKRVAARPFLHRLERIEDRHGNRLRLHYDEDRLDKVEINHPERFVRFFHDQQDRICDIRDHTDRRWSYTYDSLGDLIAVTSPETDRYESGLTVCYEYSSAFRTGELQHNLLRIIDASGKTYLENEYGTSPGLSNYNRVVRQRQGGGEYRFEYEDVEQVLDFDYPDEKRPTHQTIMVERNGQPVRHVFNKFGNLLRREQCIFEDGLPRILTEQYRYNRDGKVIASLSPEGVLVQHLHGRDWFVRRHGLTPAGNIPTDPLTWQERQAFGRVRATVHRDGYARFPSFNLTNGSWGDFPDIIDGIFPTGMGDRKNDIIVKYTYESEYGQLRTISDPRFTDTPDPQNSGEDPRHEETLTEYVYEGPTVDPNRFLVEIRRPTPTLPDGTDGAQVVDAVRLDDGSPGYDKQGRLLRSVDPVGTVTERTYVPEDPNDPREGYLQEEVVDPDGLAITTRYEVDDRGLVEATHLPRASSVTDDRFVRRTVYNNLDQVIQTTTSRPFEFETRRFYDRNGKLERTERELKDKDGRDILDGIEVNTYCYDEEFNLIEETRGGTDLSAHLETKHGYDATGQRVLTVLPKGNEVRTRYDERLLPIAETMGAGTEDAATTKTDYDGDGRVQRTFDARGNATTYTRDAFGRVTTEEDALGHIVKRDYDKLGNVIVERFFENRLDGYYLLARTETEYDELERARRVGENRFGEPKGPISAEQLETAFLEDPVPDATVLSTRTFYDAQGRVTKTVDPRQRERTYGYDALGRVIEETDPLDNRILYHYDEHDNLTRRDRVDLERDPDNLSDVLGQQIFSTSFSYDELDRKVSSTDSLGNLTQFFYDSRDNLVRRVDPLGNVVRMEYDIYDRPIAEHRELTESGLGNDGLENVALTRLEYDKNDNLTRVVDALGRHMRFRYDALNRRKAINFPDDSEFLYEYDSDGNLIRTKDNNGLERHYTVDTLGRTTLVDVDTSELADLQVAGATFERYTYDGLDRRVREENDFAHCETSYNSLGWPIEESITFTTSDAPMRTPFVVSREFNEVGALTGLTYPNGRQLSFVRDELNHLTAVRNVLNGTGYPGDAAIPDSHDIITKIKYAGRQRRRCQLGNGAITTYAHDGAARIIEINHEASAESVLQIQYLYDALSNVRIRNNITPAGNLGESFGYDSLYRLVDEAPQNVQPLDTTPLAPASALPPDPIPDRQSSIDALIGSMALSPDPKTFDYDRVGNRDVERTSNNEIIEYSRNELNQYTHLEEDTTSETIFFTYDKNGNLKSDGERKYLYDSLNRLVKVEDEISGDSMVQYFHDARGRRILKLGTDVTNQLIFDGENIVAEYRNGQLLAQYVLDDGVDRPFQIAAEGDEHWYHNDLIGSVRLLTNGVGEVAASYRYTPFGRSNEDDNENGIYNPLRYTARRLDKELGTYDYRARQYDPQLGRFQQRDPAGPVESTNMYPYARNSPLAFNDPFGTEARPEQAKTYAPEFVEGGGIGVGISLFGGWTGKAGGALAQLPQPVELPRVRRATETKVNLTSTGDVESYHLTTSDIKRLLLKGLPPGGELTSFEVGLTELPINEYPGVSDAFQIIMSNEGIVGYKLDFDRSGFNYKTRKGTLVGKTPGTEAGLGSPGFTPLDVISMGTGLARGISKQAGKRFIKKTSNKANRGLDLDEEIEMAVERAETAYWYRLPGQNPRTGEGLKNVRIKSNPEKDIWFHDELDFRNVVGSPRPRIQVRTHSPNPNAPKGSYSKMNPTTQIDTKKGNFYRLPDGTWKRLSEMKEAEKAAAHYP